MAPLSQRSRSLARTVTVIGLVSACGGTTAPADRADLVAGTWGATGSAVIVGDSTLHVHIGCTKGDFPLPSSLDAEGRFSVRGTYNVRAYPVEQLRDVMPAQLTASLMGRRLTLRVVVSDSTSSQPVILGPVTVTRGVAPQMGPCPVCRAPDGMARAPRGPWERLRAWWDATWR